MRVVVPEKDFHYFEDVGTVIKYRSGEYIFTAGDPAETIYLIRSGRVLISATMENGTELSFDVLRKGHIFGDGSFVAHYRREVDISAVTDVELIVCKTEKLLPVLSEHQDLMLLMFRHITEVTNEMSHQIVRLMHYSGKQKIADFILACTGKSSTMHYTHSDIAAGVGLNRVTVSNIMKDLRKDGLIDYSYGLITVLDRKGLEDMLPEG